MRSPRKRKTSAITIRNDVPIRLRRHPVDLGHDSVALLDHAHHVKRRRTALAPDLCPVGILARDAKMAEDRPDDVIGQAGQDLVGIPAAKSVQVALDDALVRGVGRHGGLPLVLMGCSDD